MLIPYTLFRINTPRGEVLALSSRFCLSDDVLSAAVFRIHPVAIISLAVLFFSPVSSFSLSLRSSVSHCIVLILFLSYYPAVSFFLFARSVPPLIIIFSHSFLLHCFSSSHALTLSFSLLSIPFSLSFLPPSHPVPSPSLPPPTLSLHAPTPFPPSSYPSLFHPAWPCPVSRLLFSADSESRAD